jgi:diguanylate cyclase (GGDEF)-like protein/PAS domain S-box-containing protein
MIELRPDLVQVLDQLRDGVYFVDRTRRISHWNKAAEQITGFTREQVLSHFCADNILIHVDAEGRNLCRGACPLSISMRDARPHESELFLHHRDGHRVPVFVRVTPLEDENRRVIGAVELFSPVTSQDAWMVRMAELEQLALLDPLTRLPNRRQLDSELVAQFALLHRSGLPFGVLFFDIDRFKRFNDDHGHQAGDRALQVVARTLQASSRPFDTIGRWGGEEFVGLYPNVTAELLAAIARRLAMLVRTSHIDAGDRVQSVTVSVGGTVARRADTPQTLLARADALMYQSKQSGRDRATIG